MKNKRTKKVATLAVLGITVLGLIAACGGKDSSSPTPTTTRRVETTTAPTTPTTTPTAPVG